ncbi:uncharacterized protein MEPE_04842 [Melanopsichium pennsylvanicum]|uniref:Uncharacterized protein n=1 Tax=Melanopsichium pennsylvanicum TaxID=63383 RepID=A0AAJ4XPV3_9BASI|nr:uncharacterized protein MEPE_04842 [Melanopsichium pennsylvanicum]
MRASDQSSAPLSTVTMIERNDNASVHLAVKFQKEALSDPDGSERFCEVLYWTLGELCFCIWSQFFVVAGPCSGLGVWARKDESTDGQCRI